MNALVGKQSKRNGDGNKQVTCTQDTTCFKDPLHSGLLSLLLQVKLIFLPLQYQMKISECDIHETRII